MRWVLYTHYIYFLGGAVLDELGKVDKNIIVLSGYHSIEALPENIRKFVQVSLSIILIQ